MYFQCFHQTAPLRRVAIRDGPQKNGKRANLALYFCKAEGFTQALMMISLFHFHLTNGRHSILMAIPRLKIATNTVANATNMSFLEAKNSGLVAIITTLFLYVGD